MRDQKRALLGEIVIQLADDLYRRVRFSEKQADKDKQFTSVHAHSKTQLQLLSLSLARLSRTLFQAGRQS